MGDITFGNGLQDALYNLFSGIVSSGKKASGSAGKAIPPEAKTPTYGNGSRTSVDDQLDEIRASNQKEIDSTNFLSEYGPGIYSGYPDNQAFLDRKEAGAKDSGKNKEVESAGYADTPVGLLENYAEKPSFAANKAPRSEAEAWDIYQATHDVPDEYKGELGYINLLKSGDSDTWAQWAQDDPQEMLRLLNSGIDVTDVENLSKNIYDYKWGDNAISLYDYMTSGGESGVDIGNDAAMIAKLGKYLNEEYGYGFDPSFSSKYGTDQDDIIAQMLARQLTNYGLGTTNLSQLNELLPQYLEGGAFAYLPEDSEDYKATKEKTTKGYGNILDEDELFADALAASIAARYNKTDHPGGLKLAIKNASKSKAPSEIGDASAAIGY